MDETKTEPLTFTLMLLGDSCTGKTCLLIRFKDNAFLNNNFISTVGIDYRNKIVNVDGKDVKLQIWDTAGQERFRSVTHAYYRDAHALMLVFDVTNRISFENIRNWLSEVQEFGNEGVLVLLVGNKTDLPNRRVKSDEAKELASTYSIQYIETSAKTGSNVKEAFESIARSLMTSKSKSNGAANGGVSLSDNKSNTVANKSYSGYCCGTT